MPLKSLSQMRMFFAKEKSGELPKGTAKKWIRHTPNLKDLPERVNKNVKQADGAPPDVPPYVDDAAVPWTQGVERDGISKTGFVAGFLKTAAIWPPKNVKSMAGVMDKARSSYNEGVLRKMQRVPAPSVAKKAPDSFFVSSFGPKHVIKTAGSNLAQDAAEESSLNKDMQNFVPGTTLRESAETGQARQKNYRSKGVLNESKEFGQQYKQKAQTARGGKNYGGTISEGFSQDGAGNIPDTQSKSS